jgi:hypothetical protein
MKLGCAGLYRTGSPAPRRALPFGRCVPSQGPADRLEKGGRTIEDAVAVFASGQPPQQHPRPQHRGRPRSMTAAGSTPQRAPTWSSFANSNWASSLGSVLVGTNAVDPASGLHHPLLGHQAAVGRPARLQPPRDRRRVMAERLSDLASGPTLVRELAADARTSSLSMGPDPPVVLRLGHSR